MLVAVGVMGFAWLFLEMYLPTYAAALPLAAALLISLPFRALALVVTEWFYAAHKQKELFISSAVPKLASLVLLPILLPFIGLAGIVIWQVLSADAVLLARMHYLKKELPLKTGIRSLLVLDARDFELLARGWARIAERLTTRKV